MTFFGCRKQNIFFWVKIRNISGCWKHEIVFPRTWVFLLCQTVVLCHMLLSTVTRTRDSTDSLEMSDMMNMESMNCRQDWSRAEQEEGSLCWLETGARSERVDDTFPTGQGYSNWFLSVVINNLRQYLHKTASWKHLVFDDSLPPGWSFYSCIFYLKWINSMFRCESS